MGCHRDLVLEVRGNEIGLVKTKSPGR